MQVLLLFSFLFSPPSIQNVTCNSKMDHGCSGSSEIRLLYIGSFCVDFLLFSSRYAPITPSYEVTQRRNGVSHHEPIIYHRRSRRWP